MRPSFAFLRTLRGRLLLLALLVETAMVALLVANDLRLVRDRMVAQARDHAGQIAPVLKAALAAPMAQDDQATLQAVLDESRASRGLSYVAVVDRSGGIVAASGWIDGLPLPLPNDGDPFERGGRGERYDVASPIVLAGQPLGTLRFGLDLSPILEARSAVLSQGVGIAAGLLALSAAVLSLFGRLLTRRLSLLVEASRSVAQGQPAATVPEGDDDVGRLGTAFNQMSHEVASRIGEISRARDETARLLAEVEQEHARLAALLAAMEVGILFSDRSDRVVYANGTFFELWGLAQQDLDAGDIGRVAARLAAATTEPDCWRREFVEGRAPRAEFPLVDGRRITLHRREVTAPGGASLGRLWIFADVTARRREADDLLRAKERAEAAALAKATFLATMSHEIRTPMNGILGMTELLLLSELQPAQREQLQIVKGSADALLTILNEILDYSKIESQGVALEAVPFDPRELVGDIVALFAPHVADKSVSIGQRLGSGVPAAVIGDPTRLRQVLTNLVSNAAKFTHAGEIVVALDVDPAVPPEPSSVALRFDVRDTGIGIPAEKLDVVFQAFAQADGSTARQFGGTGLGLAISRRLALAMGGTLTVESAVGVGSCFTLRMRAPLAELRPDPVGLRLSTQGVPLGDGARRRALRVLVAEDTPVSQLVLSGMLRKLGHDPHVVGDGAQALEAVRESRYDVVLMDMLMPVMDGLSAARAIRACEPAAGPRVPIVALTANAFPSDRQACLDAGMDEFLSKPVKLAELDAMLAKVTESA